ncbi:cation-translocating P-type ATPase [Rhizobium leucaenae]|uniref:cation-translocating P-type ATPase n=1 Tax=Rhizobium leucaenae TaxID=29450 RepID=UPI0007EE92EB|nr:cation-transporting P-type ATPase [Rhizobium leucaenae]
MNFVDRPITQPENPHAVPAERLTEVLRVSADYGLSTEEVDRRRRAFGLNEIAERRPAEWFPLLLHQFMSPVVYLLAAAATLAFCFNELEEGGAIAAVLVVNAAIGFFTELKATRSIEALRALGTHTARVRRNGIVRLVPSEDLVPGDIVIFEAGDAVPADIRLIEASRVAANESTLTGESVPVEKDVQTLAQSARLSERQSMLFKGTAITRGSATGVVTATGPGTELGKISRLVVEADAGSSPLERNLTLLSKQLVGATLALASLIAALGIIAGKDELLIVESAIALAVAAIPEGLPIVATLALARGMWRMARQNALIERLSAVETLGATTVILTDKTGTLTENKMAARCLCTTEGEFDFETENAVEALPIEVGANRQLALLLKLAVLCNDADLECLDATGTGDPMEIALLRVGLQGGFERAALLLEHPVLHKHSFDPAKKMMATIHSGKAGILVAVKGAPEAVIHSAAYVSGDAGEIALDEKERSAWLSYVNHLACRGLRVLACAVRQGPEEPADPFKQLVLIGLIGLEDPVRADVPQAIHECQNAGIRVIMVTGDHAATAKSIGRAVGLSKSPAASTVEGKTIDEMLKTGHPALRDVSIFARVDPSEKLALVRAYQSAGETVAMTGDGVNDAPALRQADIGVAMGLRGTDVAREASAMILLDDAFPTIVRAIREGRIIFSNIRRLIKYLLSCNLSELIVVGIAVAGSLPLPLLPLQILYLNLVTDVFPAFALAMGEGNEGILDEPPRDPKEPILGRAQWIAIVMHGATLSAATFAALVVARVLAFDQHATVTSTFLTLAFSQLWHAFNMRSLTDGVILNEITRNRWLWAALALCAVLLAVPPYFGPAADLLQLVPLTANMWLVVLVSSIFPLVATQIVMVTARLLDTNRR